MSTLFDLSEVRTKVGAILAAAPPDEPIATREALTQARSEEQRISEALAKAESQHQTAIESADARRINNTTSAMLSARKALADAVAVREEIQATTKTLVAAADEKKRRAVQLLCAQAANVLGAARNATLEKYQEIDREAHLVLGELDRVTRLEGGSMPALQRFAAGVVEEARPTVPPPPPPENPHPFNS